MKYCLTCGTEMEVKKKSFGYSGIDGRKMYLYIYFCPKRKWWHIFQHPSQTMWGDSKHIIGSVA